MTRIRRRLLAAGTSVALVAVTGLGYARSRAPETVAADTTGAAPDDPAASGVLTLSPEARANIGLTLTPVERRTVVRTLVLNATVQVHPDREAFVSSRVQGKVTAVNANVGDVVERGQPLVVIQSLQIAETPPMVAVTSPLGGVVLERMVTLGETVDATKSLMHVADLSRVIAQADVYEADVASVRVGQLARLRLTPYPDRIFNGRVVRLGDSIDPVRRTLRVWIEVRNTPDRKLKPDMFAQVNLIIASSGPVATVPNEAVQNEGPERFVFVQDGENYVRQNVVLGDHDDRYTAIVSGVVEGDLVVTRGAAELKTVAVQATAGGVQDEGKPHGH